MATPKATRKTPVKKPTTAKTPSVNKYMNHTDLNIFTPQGKVMPKESIMLTDEEAQGLIG